MTVKETLMQMVPEFPDDISWEEARYRLYLKQTIEESMRQIEEGEVYTQQEAEEKLAKWLK